MTSMVETSIQAVSPALRTATDFSTTGVTTASTSAAAVTPSEVCGTLSCAHTGATPIVISNPLTARAPANNFLILIMLPLKCFFSGFAGTNTNHLLQVMDENLAIANFSGTCRCLDCFNRAIHDSLINRCLYLRFGQQIHHMLSTAIHLGMAFLTSEAFDLCHGNTLYTDRRQRFAHFTQFEGFDNC